MPAGHVEFHTEDLVAGSLNINVRLTLPDLRTSCGKLLAMSGAVETGWFAGRPPENVATVHSTLTLAVDSCVRQAELR